MRGCRTLCEPNVASICVASNQPMTETAKKSAAASPAQIPEDLALEVRRLAHELSNALEIIVQTSYLLGTAGLKEPALEWHRMLDSGVQKALDINLALRTYIKTHSPQ